MLGRHVRHDAVSVADHRVDQPLARTLFRQNLPGLDAVFSGIPFVIHIVEKTHDAPKIRLVPVALLPGEIPHHRFYRIGVLQVKGLSIVVFEQGQRPVAGQFHLLYPPCLTFHDHHTPLRCPLSNPFLMSRPGRPHPAAGSGFRHLSLDKSPGSRYAFIS